MSFVSYNVLLKLSLLSSTCYSMFFRDFLFLFYVIQNYEKLENIYKIICLFETFIFSILEIDYILYFH